MKAIDPAVIERAKAVARDIDMKEAIILLALMLSDNGNEQNRQLDGIRDAIVDASLKMY